jgi:hypothetical protein
MNLKRGITGFSHLNENFALPAVNFSFVKSLAYQIYASANFNVLKISDMEISTNYYSVEMLDKMRNFKFAVLFNAQYPYYCGVTIESSWMKLSFIDLDLKIRNHFDKEFEFLAPALLNQTVNSKDLNDLSKTEKDQIKYWNSRTYGEIIFNGYD